MFSSLKEGVFENKVLSLILTLMKSEVTEEGS
jgi:hypothetical protein